MSDQADLYERLLEKIQRQATVVTGQVTAVTSTGVTVDVGGTAMTPTQVALCSPVVGDTVLMLSSPQSLTLVAVLAGARPASGTVTAVPGGSNTISVQGADGVTYVLPYLSTYTPVVGHVVTLAWQSSEGSVSGRRAVAPTPPPAPTTPAAPPGSPTAGQSVFVARDAATWRDGKWRTDASGIYQGVAPGYAPSNSGSWFYGGGPGAALAGATITGAAIWLRRASGGVYAAQAVHLYRHTSSTRPGTDVSRVAGPHDVSLAVGDSGWYPLPVAFAQAIVDSGGGIGITGSPYVQLAGPATDAQSGALRLDWTRPA